MDTPNTQMCGEATASAAKTGTDPITDGSSQPSGTFSLAAAVDRLKGREPVSFTYDNTKILKWFALTNAAIILSVFLVTGLCGGHPFHSRQIWTWTGICVLVGSIAPFVMLALSKFLAKKIYSIRMITAASAKTDEERKLVDLVGNLANRAALPSIPEIGVSWFSRNHTFRCRE